MQLWTLLSESPLCFVLIMGALGLIVGSFLNVVIHRLPIMMQRQWQTECASLAGAAAAGTASPPYNLLVPRSRCPHCAALITARDNIPIASYLMLGGRCRQCKARIALRYPIVEALCGVITATVAWRFGFGVPALLAAGFSWALLALAAIDFDTQLLPDSITLPCLWLGILANYFGLFVDLEASVLGASAGYLSLWIVYWAFKLVTGKEGMGYGDFKLAGMICAWLGWQALPVVIILSSVVGAAVGISLIAFRGHDRAMPIPFGPYLACAGWITLIWGEDLAGVYTGGGGL